MRVWLHFSFLTLPPSLGFFSAPSPFVSFFLYSSTMGVANVPFPSFTLVLTSSRVVIPGPSSVRAMPDVQIPPKHLMSTLRNDDREVEESDFSLNLQNASAVGHVESDKEVPDTMPPATEEEEENMGLQIGGMVIVQSSKGRPARFFLKTLQSLFNRRMPTFNTS